MFYANPPLIIYRSRRGADYRHHAAQEAREKEKRSRLRQTHSCAVRSKTCVVGYNNVRFDDEVTRNIFITAFTIPTHGMAA